MNNLSVTAIQASLFWENRDANLEHLSVLMDDITHPTNLVLLPEMFTTGFTMKPELHAEHFDRDQMVSLNWMRMYAAKLNAVVCGSISTEENEHYFNRLFWVRSDGTFSTYDKRHLFSMGNENHHYKQGNQVLIEEVNGWKILPLICYDLRFPVWSRNTLIEGKPAYDLLIYVANWPEVRREPWKKLLPARAIENQSYLVGLNRVGLDGHGLPHSGNSAFINPRGEYLQQFIAHKEEVRTQEFSWSELEEFRTRFPALNDADEFEIKQVD